MRKLLFTRFKANTLKQTDIFQQKHSIVNIRETECHTRNNDSINLGTKIMNKN